jgi:hypothetical protein
MVNQNTQSDRQTLEAFLLDNPDIARLEAMLDEFNLFEAIGAVRQELRHSDFLAFLLNPQERHGLGSVFTQRFLLAVVQAAEEETAVTPLDLALWSGDNLEVRREWRNIDILLLDAEAKLAVLIENKVDSDEHSQQLTRYWRTARQHFPGWRILAIFLTPDGRDPSHASYLPADYGLINTLINELIQAQASTIGPDVQTALRHYAQLLRRHIMPDSDIAQLCQRIYRKHQRALDLIFEHRPDLQGEMRDFLVKMIEETPGMALDHPTKTWIRCCPEAWDTPILRQGSGWTSSNRMLLLEFGNDPARLHLKVKIGPGPQEIRERLLNLAVAHQPPFVVAGQSVSARNRHKTIYSQDLLRANDYEDASMDELRGRVQAGWDQFVDEVLPEITAVLQSAGWLWTEPDKVTSGEL